MTQSLAALLFANAVPLFGVLFLGWSAAPILGLYWLETLIIGGFTVLRIVTCRGGGVGPSKFFVVPFFCVHFGLFMFVHGVFLTLLIGIGIAMSASPVEMLEGLAEELFAYGGAWIAIGALVVSHGISYFTNFLGRGEYLEKHPAQLMMAPYGRVVVMHLTVLFGGILTVAFGQMTVLLLLLIVGKTMVDARAHRREHRHSIAP